jgi:long-chain acyl-CoA synthetase
VIDFLIERFAEFGEDDAIVWHDQSFSYSWLAAQYRLQLERLSSDGVGAGVITTLEADFSPTAVAVWLALLARRAIQIPLTSASGDNRQTFMEIAETELRISVDEHDEVTIQPTGVKASQPLFAALRDSKAPGLVLFSSGSTGEPKGAVHDLSLLLEKFKLRRHAYRTIPFLLYDHIGGINTLLYTLANGGALVVVDDRSPAAVLKTIEKHRVQLLPTSPSFMNRVLLSNDFRSFDISSLELVTYGTEPMPESTLARFHEEFPDVRLLQTYGLSELGILRSKSKSSDSLWMKIGGEGFDTRIVDGLLEVKANSAMLGYLNAASPFTEDGWFMTGDAVEVDGEWIKVLGRVSDLINVGGEKVYPAEVESVIQELSQVNDVAVTSIPNTLLGQAIVAQVVPEDPSVDRKELRRLVRAHCASRLERFKVPTRVDIIESVTYNPRYKKMR